MLSLEAVVLCVFIMCFSNSEGKPAINDSYQYYSGLQVQLKLNREPVDWQMARMHCHDEGAILAAPWNEQFWSFLLQHVTKREDLTIYAGVQEHFPEGMYRNISGKLSLSRKSQDTVDLARCVIYHSNGTRNLVDCKLPFAYVCQAPVAETSGCLGVGNEGIDFKLDYATGSCYKFHDTRKTWYDAYKTCQKEGAYLAIINSITEVEILKKMIEKHLVYKPKYSSNPYRMLYDEYAVAVGFYYWKEAETYVTIQGESIAQAGYEKWDERHTLSRSICGGIMYSNGNLGEVEKSKLVPFICEKTPVQQKTKYPLWFF